MRSSDWSSYVCSSDLDVAICRDAYERGLITRPLSLYYAGNPQPGLLLGYACVSEERITPSFGLLSQVVEPVMDRLVRSGVPSSPQSSLLNADAWSGA